MTELGGAAAYGSARIPPRVLGGVLVVGALVGLITAGTNPLFAQSFGDQVRVTTRAATTFGQVLQAGPDSLEFVESASGVTRSLAWGDIDSLERSLGTSSRWKWGLGAGLALGLGLWLVVESCSEWDCDSKLDWMVPAAAGLGLVTGYSIKYEKWESIEFAGWRGALAPAVGLRLGGQSGPAAILGGRLRF